MSPASLIATLLTSEPPASQGGGRAPGDSPSPSGLLSGSPFCSCSQKSLPASPLCTGAALHTPQPIARGRSKLGVRQSSVTEAASRPSPADRLTRRCFRAACHPLSAWRWHSRQGIQDGRLVTVPSGSRLVTSTRPDGEPLPAQPNSGRVPSCKQLSGPRRRLRPPSIQLQGLARRGHSAAQRREPSFRERRHGEQPRPLRRHHRRRRLQARSPGPLRGLAASWAAEGAQVHRRLQPLRHRQEPQARRSARRTSRSWSNSIVIITIH